jgi:hypothetical protein
MVNMQIVNLHVPVRNVGSQPDLRSRLEIWPGREVANESAAGSSTLFGEENAMTWQCQVPAQKQDPLCIHTYNRKSIRNSNAHHAQTLSRSSHVVNR